MADGREEVRPVMAIPTGEVNVGWKASFEVWEDDERWAELLTSVHRALDDEMRKKGVAPVRVQRRVSFHKWVDLIGEQEVTHTERPDSVRVEMRAKVYPLRIEDVTPYAQRRSDGV